MISLIWSKTQILSELQEIIYEIHLKFAKELISELRLNEKNPGKKCFSLLSIGLKGVESFSLKFRTFVLSFEKRKKSPERLD